jgi:uncharacterized membrane protein
MKIENKAHSHVRLMQVGFLLMFLGRAATSSATTTEALVVSYFFSGIALVGFGMFLYGLFLWIYRKAKK